MKKIIATVLAFVMLLGTVAIGVPEGGIRFEFSLRAFAVSEVASGTCGDNLTWVLDEEGTLTINGEGKMKRWGEWGVGQPWNKYSSMIKKVVIGEGVDSISDYSFYGYSNMMDFSLASSVLRIGEGAFSGCTGLTAIAIPDNVVEIGYYAFYDCTEVEEIIIGDGLKEIKYGTFCSQSDKLKSITFGSSIEAIDEFNYDNWKSVSHIEVNNNYSFAGFEFEYYEFDGESYQFAGYRNDTIESISFGENVSAIPYFLKTSYSLKNIEIDEKNKTLSSIDNCVYSADGNKLIYCPRSREGVVIVSDKAKTIGANAFGNCNQLTQIVLPDKLNSIEEMAFLNCYSLTGMEIPDNVNSIGCSAFRNCSGLLSVELPSDLEIIPAYLFEYCSSLTEVKMPDNIKSIEEGAFLGCSSLKKIDIPEGVKSIGYDAFHNCGSLSSISIPKSVEVIVDQASGNPFGYCAFYGCESLTEIIVAEDNEKFASVDGMLFNKDLTYLMRVLPQKSGELMIPDTVTLIHMYAASDCSQLTHISLPTTYSETVYFPLGSVGALKSFYIPSGVETVYNYYGNIYYDNLTDVYYGGSEEEWRKIWIHNYEYYDIYLCDEIEQLGAKVHFNALGAKGTPITISNDSTSAFVTIDANEKVVGSETNLIIKQISDMPSITQNLGDSYFLYDITLENKGVSVQPTHAVTVSIPVPSEYSHGSSKVYHVLNDGTVVDMNAVEKKGYLVFTTDHFSYYALVQNGSRLSGDVNGDGKITMIDSTVLRRYLAGWEGVTINETNADVNGDGEVTILDSTILRRYLANWAGVELK